MWLNLEGGQQCRIRLVDRQSIWPAPDGSDAELVVTTEAELRQDVILSTNRVARLAYLISDVSGTMTLGDNPPAPWPDTTLIRGKSFEIMLTDRGAMVVPSHGPKLPNRLRSWLEMISEATRSAWPVPPDNATNGGEWQLMPAVPGGLPPGTTSAQVKVSYRMEKVDDVDAEVLVRYGLKVALEGPHAKHGEGRGDANIHLDKRLGLQSSARVGRLELIRPQTRNQVIRSSTELRRLDVA